MNAIMTNLVNSAHGIYSASVLAETHTLYIQNNRIVEESIKVDNDYYTPFGVCFTSEFDGFEDETEKEFFNPENKFFHENVDYISNGMCRVLIEEQLMEIIEIDGEYFALNPKAVWDEDTEEYKLN